MVGNLSSEPIDNGRRNRNVFENLTSGILSDRQVPRTAFTFKFPCEVSPERITKRDSLANRKHKGGEQVMLTFIGKIRAKKNLITVGILVGLFVLSGALQPAHAQSCTYYASPTGSDSNSHEKAPAAGTFRSSLNPVNEVVMVGLKAFVIRALKFRSA